MSGTTWPAFLVAGDDSDVVAPKPRSGATKMRTDSKIGTAFPDYGWSEEGRDD
jgi:hypothetical protein